MIQVKEDAPSPASQVELLVTLHVGHPRLTQLASMNRFDIVRQEMPTDSELAMLFSSLEFHFDGDLNNIRPAILNPNQVFIPIGIDRGFLLLPD